MRNLDIKGGLEYQADISEGIFAEIKHRQSRDNNLNGIPHTLKIMLSEKRGHGGSGNGGGFPFKEGMIALLVAAAVV